MWLPRFVPSILWFRARKKSTKSLFKMWTLFGSICHAQNAKWGTGSSRLTLISPKMRFQHVDNTFSIKRSIGSDSIELWRHTPLFGYHLSLNCRFCSIPVNVCSFQKSFFVKLLFLVGRVSFLRQILCVNPDLTFYFQFLWSMALKLWNVKSRYVNQWILCSLESSILWLSNWEKFGRDMIM